jgi:RNA polymerase sigma-70 factor (ECF subfamily)
LKQPGSGLTCNALAALGPDEQAQRDLAQLVFVDDRPLAEVARRLGIPHGTVKSRLHRLRRRLQAALR